ncbi:hypothetical protein QEH52_05085 [Coraliomargarita sp. SDUM461003]|uniref:Apea-like HEPN domain-containing protein n=1 Tax=Thalassobacterium maritimum TaxID=3041265 RepID=A0ABU1AS02_9BACT|nr:hypothetical protein [Coraliomargarita sp. SDUM461003]MDQ8206871.1 hypothetical protein [Coraliomargarita sp. SDUM461003]
MSITKINKLDDLLRITFLEWHEEYVANTERSIVKHHEHIWANAVKVKPSELPSDWSHDPDDAYRFTDDIDQNINDWILPRETIQTLYIDHFSTITRGSSLVILIASFEKRLNDLCNSIKCHDQDEIKLSLSDIKGKSYADRVAKYLEKVVGINAGKSTNDERWQNINHLFHIRHKIAHTGDSYNLNKAEQDWIKQHGYKDIEFHGIKGGFLHFSLECINKYEQLLLDGIADKYYRPADEDLDPLD